MAVELIEKAKSDAEQRVADLDKGITTFEEQVAPLVAERNELTEFLARMRAEAPEASTAAGNGAPAAPRRGRPRKGSDTRADEFLKVVKENPGISTSEVAEKMGIKPNYLYRIKSDSVKAGTVRSEGRKLFVT